MAGETEVQGIALGLSLDTAGWSSGIAKAKAELEGLRRSAANLSVNATIGRGRASGAGPGVAAGQAIYDPVVSPGFQVSRGAVRDLRVNINQQLRQLHAQGEAVQIPIKLGRVSFAALRNEIAQGIGTVPIRVSISNTGAQRDLLTAFISANTGATMGQARASVESAAASRGIPKRAFGGPVTAGQPYVVGENRRSEIFVPGTSGRIIPQAMGGAQILGRLRNASSQLQPHHIAGGVDWYRQAGQLAAQKAAQYGMELRQAQGILAALSAGTSWESNKTKFDRVLSDRSLGKPFRYSMQLDAHRKAAAILGGADPSTVFASSPKVSQFFRGIAGDPNALTLDRWAMRTSMGRDVPPRGVKARAALEQAWFTAAGERGLAPAEYQAALWLQEKEQSGQAPGQIGLGLARGGNVSPGQKGMFFSTPQRGFCTWCRVSYPAGGAGKHGITDSHQAIVSGRRSPRGSAYRRARTSMRSAASQARIDSRRASTYEPSEDELLSWKMSDSPRYASRVMAARPYMPGDEEPDWDGQFLPHFARGGFWSGVFRGGPKVERDWDGNPIRPPTAGQETRSDASWTSGRSQTNPETGRHWSYGSAEDMRNARDFRDQQAREARSKDRSYTERTTLGDTRTQLDKLRAMADQSVSPNESQIARRILRERGVPGYLRGGRTPMLGPGEAMPPPFGTAPLREGYVRGYHMTKPTEAGSAAANLASIRAHGLRINRALGHQYGEPDANWFSGDLTGYDEAHAVEAHLPARWFNRDKLRTDPWSIGGPSSNMAVESNISRRRIASWNAPWMRHYRYMANEVGRTGGTSHPEPWTPGALIREYGPTVAGLRRRNAARADQTPGMLPYEAETQGWDQFIANTWRGRHRARGGFAGGVKDLRRLKAEYNRSVGLPAPQEGFYHELNPDFSTRTAAAYEGLPGGSSPSDVAAYRAFAGETEAQYRLLRKAGYTFSPSREDPYTPAGGLTKMELAGRDALRNKHLSAFASSLDHPLLSKRENWIFRGVHDMFGHLAEGFSVGPRGEFNAAASHSQMYSSLAQRAMLAETHGQNSVVNFSPTIAPGFGRSIAEVNKEHPGTIYAAQKARVLPAALVDEFNARIGVRRAKGGPVEDPLKLGSLMDEWRAKLKEDPSIGIGGFIQEVDFRREQAALAKQASQAKNVTPKMLEIGPGRRARGGTVSAIAALMRETKPWQDPMARRRGMEDLGYDYLNYGDRYVSDRRSQLRSTRDTVPVFPWIGPWSKQARGGDVPPGTFIVGEIGRERFVPKTQEGIIPPDVAAQIPGGGLLARRLAREAVPEEPWKPAWMRRGLAKDITGQGKARGGSIDIEAGAHLWQAPEDGWIIPNRLMNRVPRALRGSRVSPGQGPMFFPDPAGEYVPAGVDVRRRETSAERRARNAELVAQQARARANAAAEARLAPVAGLDSLLGRIEQNQEHVKGAAGRRFSAIGARTPRTFIGAVIGRGVTEAATEQLQEARGFLSPYRRALPRGVDPETAINEERNRIVRRRIEATRQLNQIEDKGSEAAVGLKTEINGLRKASQDLKVHLKDVTQARHEEEDAIKNLTGPRALARQFFTLTAGFTGYQLAIQGISKAIDIGVKTAQPMIDRLEGFSTVASETTANLANSSRQLGGNVAAAIAGAAPGVGGTSLAYLQRSLGTGVNARAGAAAAQDTLKLFQTALAYQTGSSVPAVYQGQGGVFGGPILAEQLGGQIGLGEVLGRGVADFQSQQSRGQNPSISTKVGDLFQQRYGLPSWLGETALQFGGGLATAAGVPPDLLTRPLDQSPQDIERSRAAMEGLSEWTKTWNDAAARAVEIGGQQTTGLKLVTAASAGVTEELYNSADAFAKFGDYAKGTGLVLVDANNKVTQNFAKAQQTLLNAGQGFQIESRDAFAARSARELRGTIATSAYQGQLERNVLLPGQFAMESLANPPGAAGAGFGFTKTEASRYSGDITRIEGLQAQVVAGQKQALDAQRQFVKDWVVTAGQAATTVRSVIGMEDGRQVYGSTTVGGGAGATDLSALATYDQGVADVAKYGGAIRGLNDEISNAQAGLARRQFGNSIRILSRNLQDALALAGKGGTGRAGQIEREQFLLGRQAQALQLAMSQRQVNFQTAVAGFQAPGITGQERGARLAEAKLEASFAQKQLNIQKSQFALEGQAFKVQAGRAVTDLRAALDLETQSRDTTLLTIRNQKLIAANQVLLSRAQANVQSVLQQAAQNHSAVLSVADQRVKLFGGTIEGASNALRDILGLGAQHTYLNPQGQVVTTTGQPTSTTPGGHPLPPPYASGIIGATRGRTTITVGEAAGEGVAVIQNPHRVDLGSAFGARAGGGGDIYISISGNTISSDMDLERIAQVVADKVEARMGTHAKLVGLRSATG